MRRTWLLISKFYSNMIAENTIKGKSFDDVLVVVDKLTRRKPLPSSNGLEVMNLLLDRLNMREHLSKLRFVHIAGTKGKGTTSTYTAALLQSYGFKVGLFTSPHLTDIRERIKINNTFLSKELFARYFFEIQDRCDALSLSESQLSRDLSSRTNFFRLIFLVSLHAFIEEAVDVAVMEVGLGGRIDVTNVITPEVCIITALGMDHMEILGNTVEEIALDKAGIMKPGIICYTAPQNDHPSTRKVLIKNAHNVGAPVVFVNTETLPIYNWPKLAIGGVHAIEDSKLGLLAARRVAGILPTLPLTQIERKVLESTTFTGRSQIIPIHNGKDITFYLDGAHTYESLVLATNWFIEASKEHTGDLNPRCVLLFFSTREPHRVLKAFMPVIQKFSKVIMANVVSPRAEQKYLANNTPDQAYIDLMDMIECWKQLYREIPCLPCTKSFNSLQEIIDLALPAASDQEDASKPAQIFVTGSFFLLSEVLNLINKTE